MSDPKRAKKAAAEAPLPWLGALESSVRDAVERLRETATQNAALRRRVAELEDRLEEANAGAAAAPGADDADRAAWRQERQEVRRRLHRLTETLTELLDEDESS